MYLSHEMNSADYEAIRKECRMFGGIERRSRIREGEPPGEPHYDMNLSHEMNIVDYEAIRKECRMFGGIERRSRIREGEPPGEPS